MNRLYFGDNLDILRTHVKDESVDLVYLDPPFNSQARYNVLFKSPKEDAASAQVGAFLDFWSWETGEAELAYHEIVTRIGGPVATFVQALRLTLGESDMMAYLAMMAVRLIEIHRVMKRTGSIYLHCDPTASHYLKILMDSIWGANNFRNEVVWKRTTSHSDTKGRFSHETDTILFFSRSSKTTWNAQYAPHSPSYIASHYSHSDELGRKYRHDNIIRSQSMGPRPNLSYEYKGYVPPYGWRCVREKLEKIDNSGRIHWSKSGTPYLIRYLDEQNGQIVGNLWIDIPPVNSQSQERVGYPTQKPVALLDRIISASSNKDDVVLDPFCGCGTTVDAAEVLKRQWVGIDVSIHAIHVIEQRIRERFGPTRVPKAEGIPADYESAARLAKDNPFQFQWWANYLMGVHVLKEVKKGADRGIDGEVFFPNGPGRPYGRMLTSVKGGRNVGPAFVREFRGVLEREKAEMGLFICLDPPTSAMRTEAVIAGPAQVVHGQMPRLQIVSIAEWFNGRRPLMPPLEQLPYAAFSQPKSGTKSRRPDPSAPELPLSFSNESIKADKVQYLNPQMVRGAVA